VRQHCKNTTLQFLPVAGVVDDAELAGQASNAGSATLSSQQDRGKQKEESMSVLGLALSRDADRKCAAGEERKCRISIYC